MRTRTVLAATAAFGLGLSCFGTPHISLRLSCRHTESKEQWERTLKTIKENPGCCDEAWFSSWGGMAAMDFHREQAAKIAAAAADLRAIGITPSLQIQTTLGHGDDFTNTNYWGAKAWTGWTGSTGVEDRFCNCPRQPKFLAYIREMAKLYAAFKPGSVWIDDDLRVDNHRPATNGSLDGCWCATCLAAFNAENGAKWTREGLAAEVSKGGETAAKWAAFSVESLAGVARAIARGVKEVAPDAIMGQQHCNAAKYEASVRGVSKALAEESGHATGIRPGGGMYWDLNPTEQVIKSIESAAFAGRLKDVKTIRYMCPEVESWPHAHGGRSAQSVIVESFSAMMYGLSFTSYWTLDVKSESDELFGKKMLAPIARASAVLKGYAEANEGTEVVGFEADGLAGWGLYKFGLTGVPVISGMGRSLGEISADERKTDVTKVGSRKIQALRDAVAARAKGDEAIATLKSPFVGLMALRAKDGKLRTVGILSTRIEEQDEIAVSLRGVPTDAKVVWREAGKAPVELAAKDGEVTIPSVGAWNCGFLDIR